LYLFGTIHPRSMLSSAKKPYARLVTEELFEQWKLWLIVSFLPYHWLTEDALNPAQVLLQFHVPLALVVLLLIKCTHYKQRKGKLKSATRIIRLLGLDEMTFSARSRSQLPVEKNLRIFNFLVYSTSQVRIVAFLVHWCIIQIYGNFLSDNQFIHFFAISWTHLLSHGLTGQLLLNMPIMLS